MTTTITLDRADKCNTVKLYDDRNRDTFYKVWYDETRSGNAPTELIRATGKSASDWLKDAPLVHNFVEEQFGVYISYYDDFADFCVLAHLELYCWDLQSKTEEELQVYANTLSLHHRPEPEDMADA